MKKVFLLLLMLTILCACQEKQNINVSEQKETEDDTRIHNGTVYKKLTVQERKELKLTKEENYTMDEIYYAISVDGDCSNTKVLTIDNSKKNVYEEKIYGTNKILGCWSGYINVNDQFSVHYVSPDTPEFIRGSFADGKWNIERKEDKIKQAGYSWIPSKDGNLWGWCVLDPYRLTVVNSGGKVLHQLNLDKWQKQNGYSKATLIDFLPLQETRCVLIFEENGEKKSCQLDLRSKKIIRKYDCDLNGIQSGDYIYILRDNQLGVYDYKNAKEVTSINLGNLRGNCIYKELVYYDELAKEFTSIGSNPHTDITIGVNKDKVYLNLCNGLFCWTVGDDKIYKILDAESTKYLNRMNGSMEVGEDGTIYMLGFLGGIEDEEQLGATDFLVLTPKE